MMRSKRPRSLHSSHGHAGGAGGHSRTRSMSDDNLGDDHLMHMDPSLMTERQQLAFLLRKTAHEQSGGDSPASPSSESSDDDTAARRPKKRIQRPAKSTGKRLHVKTTSPTASDMEDLPMDVSSGPLVAPKRPMQKPSPSSASDITHMAVFDEHLDQSEFWSLHCALCSQSTSQFDASCEPLFLCQSCDKKYPTQRALGRV